jgi:NAD(P)-dependent dehydrogenase (short-subunit alcohol dehydrogenase family)
MAAWTAADIPDLAGRTALVTGANSGLGLETARQLAAHGATVIMACRNEARCSAAVNSVLASAPAAQVEPARLDLADPDSVRSFAGQVAAGHETIDILVNNAGVMAIPKRKITAQGFELQFATNHLGHFALTGLLLPLLAKAPGSRVVTVSSFAHERGKIDFDNLQHERDYTPYGAYYASKLANLLFMLELDRQLRRAHAETISVGAHPGFASTNLQASGPFQGASPLSARLVLASVRIFGQGAEEGAEPQLFAATAPGVDGGDYYGPKYRFRGHPAPSPMAARARDERVAARLWDVSRELTGVDLDAAIGDMRR